MVFSETIDDLKTVKLIEKLKHYPFILLRKTDEKLTTEQSEEWNKFGIHDWVGCRPPLESLREKLSQKESILSQKNSVYKQKEKQRSLSTLSLSKTELQLLRLLYQNSQKYSSREFLSVQLFNKQVTNSTLSQLSSLISRLNRKMKTLHTRTPLIVTGWGEGYKLRKLEFDQLYYDSENELHSINE